MVRNWKTSLLVGLWLLRCTSVSAQSSDTSFLWARAASKTAPSDVVVIDLRVTVLRTASGALEFGGISWRLRPDLRTPVEITALRIYQQDAAGAETLVFEYPFTPAITLRGASAINRSLPDVIPIRREDTAGLRRLQSLLDDPASHYVAFAGEGARDFRGQLFKADHQVFMSIISGGGSGPEARPRAALQIVPITARDHSGRVVFAQVLVQGTYRLPGQTTFTALQIQKGEDGAPVISVPMTGLLSAASGAGDLPGLFTTVLPEDEQAYAALHEMLRAPERFAVTLQTSGTPQVTLRVTYEGPNESLSHCE